MRSTIRWGAKDYDYGHEVMGAVGAVGAMGATMIAIQKDVSLVVNWTDDAS